MLDKLYFYKAEVPLKYITCFDTACPVNYKFIKSIRDEGLHRPLSLFIYKERLLLVCNGGSRFNILKNIIKKPNDYKVPCLLVSIFDWKFKGLNKITYDDYKKHNYMIGYKKNYSHETLFFYEKKAYGGWEYKDVRIRNTHIEVPK
tara:strand:+ start:2543 stop:2980 length:438 start_codon:yes stop_codon:yes gene_type:complete